VGPGIEIDRARRGAAIAPHHLRLERAAEASLILDGHLVRDRPSRRSNTGALRSRHPACTATTAPECRQTHGILLPPSQAECFLRAANLDSSVSPWTISPFTGFSWRDEVPRLAMPRSQDVEDLFDQRAFRIFQRKKGVLDRNRVQNLVVVPRVFRLFGRLHLD